MRDYKFWKTSEIIALKAGLIPKGRTLTACRRFCSRNGIKFPGKKVIEANHELLDILNEKQGTTNGNAQELRRNHR